MLGKRWKRATGALACLLLVLALTAGPLLGTAVQKANAAGPLKFTILHTNDEHSEIYPYDLALDYPNHPTTGGFSRIAYEIGAIKTAKAAAGEPVLTLGAGDWSQGTLFSMLETNAAPELMLMQSMGYDAVAMGNHDIELGPNYLYAELAYARAHGVKFPILSANLTFSGYPPAGGAGDANLYTLYTAPPGDSGGTQLAIQKYTVKTLSNGLKVGIFGLMGVEAEAVAPGAAPVTFGNVPGHPEDPVSFFNRVTVSQDMVNTLRGLGCDVVVALSHSGIVEEQNLANFVEGIDVIVGGHSHSLIYPPQVMGTSNTIIVQAGANGQWLGDLELQYDGSAVSPTPKVTVANAQAIHIDQNIPTVPSMDVVIDQYLAAINGNLGFDCLAPLAETDVAGNGGFDLLNAPDLAETNLGDLIADSFRVTMAGLGTPVRVGFESNGVIRTALPKGASGRFSFYDLYRTLPLGGSPYDQNAPGYPLVSFWLAGAELQGVLSEILDMGRNDFFLQMSGMRYNWNPAGATGQKLVSMEIQNAAGTAWEPVNPAGLYRLATDYYTGSFLAVFGLYPRYANGAQEKVGDVMKPFIVPDSAPPEMRAWQALTGYIQAMPDVDGDGLPNIVPTYYSTQARVTPLSWLLPEGCTSGGFETWVLIQNPNPTTATINVTYMTTDGEIVKPAFGMGPNSRNTIFVNADVPDTNQVSTKVESDQPIVVERAVYWNGRAGGTESLGEIPWSTTWYLAEGNTADGFETWVLVENPNAAPATVTLTYMTGAGEVNKAPFVMLPNSRTSVLVNSDLPNNPHVSTMVTSNIPVAVERACYWADRKAGHDSLGATAPSDSWYLAEGTTADGFEDWLLVQNPGAVASTITVTYMTAGGPVNKAPMVVPAGSRVSIFVNGDVPDNNQVSIAVEATEPVVAERACYWNGRMGGHDSLGAVAPAPVWDLAEGCTANGFETWVLVQNPNAAAVTVTFTYMTADGAINKAPFVLAANSRTTVLVNGDVPDNIQVSTKVESTGPVVVERATYWGGRIEGACSIGYAP